MTLDALALLRLQIEWGADEALVEAPVDRFAPSPPAGPAKPAPRRPPVASALPASAVPSAASLDALHAELLGFEGCALRTTATSTVRPDGNPEAGLVLVGEAPGSDDDRSGRAYSGPAGALLDRVLASIGVDRSSALLTTLSPWRPPGGRPLSEAEAQACLPFLHRLLTLVRPQQVLLVGAAPVRALAGTSTPPRRLQGRWLDVAVPGMSPAVQGLAFPPVDQWMRSAGAKQELWSQLLLLRRARSSP